ncbi:unnamed protein product [Trifolium pratense]|uniref:Uncharacterized protein n=1 Tax=Trifolium pratense TaxID=57577 RepID=A0ACB0JNM1_TRIPR|nr:unnamed protein product [Trifolium pratense]
MVKPANKKQEEHDQQQHLPTYDPLSHVAKKELSRIKSAQKAVHLIPLLVLLCAIILWFFSSPTKSSQN